MNLPTINQFLQAPQIKLPSLIAVKDLNHRFIAISDGLVHYTGRPFSYLFGSYDENMPWGTIAAQFIDHDIATLCGDSAPQLHQLSPTNFLLVQKFIIHDNQGQKKGTYSHYIPLTDEQFEALFSQRPLHRTQKLSKKEHQILSMLVQGYKRSEIIKRCEISISTYNFHIMNLKKKLRVNTTHQLILHAVKRDLFPLPGQNYP